MTVSACVTYLLTYVDNRSTARLAARTQQALQYAELPRMAGQREALEAGDRLGGDSSRREAHALRPQMGQRGLPAGTHEPPAPRRVGDEGPACEHRGGALPLGELPLAPRGEQQALRVHGHPAHRRVARGRDVERSEQRLKLRLGRLGAALVMPRCVGTGGWRRRLGGWRAGGALEGPLVGGGVGGGEAGGR